MGDGGRKIKFKRERREDGDAARRRVKIEDRRWGCGRPRVEV